MKKNENLPEEELGQIVERRSPSWQWLAITVIGILGVLSLIIFNDAKSDIRSTKTDIAQLKEQKLDKETYYRDMADIKGNIETVLKLQIEHIKESKK